MRRNARLQRSFLQKWIAFILVTSLAVIAAAPAATAYPLPAANTGAGHGMLGFASANTPCDDDGYAEVDHEGFIGVPLSQPADRTFRFEGGGVSVMSPLQFELDLCGTARGTCTGLDSIRDAKGRIDSYLARTEYFLTDLSWNAPVANSGEVGFLATTLVLKGRYQAWFDGEDFGRGDVIITMPFTTLDWGGCFSRHRFVPFVVQLVDDETTP